METINSRIRKVFEQSQKSKSEIARLLKVTPAYISKLTNNDNAIPSDRLIDDICMEFRISEEWLRTGEGDMPEALDREQEITEFIGKVMRDEKDSFRKRFIAALSGLTMEDWKALEHIADELAKRKTDP